MPPQSDSGSHTNPTIPELVSSLRYSFTTADFDRVEQTLIDRDTKLKKENQRLREERSRLEKDSEGWMKRISALEDDVMKTVRLMGDDYGDISSVENLERLFEYMIAAKANGTLKKSGKTSRMERVIEKQKEEYAKLEKEHTFEMQRMQKVENHYATLLNKHQLQLKEKDKVENEMKGFRMEIEQLKEKLSVMEEKHSEDNADIEKKHCLELLKIENELKVCKDAIDESKKKHMLVEEQHENDYEALEKRYRSQCVEVEIELKDCQVEMQKLKEKLSVIEETHREDNADVEKEHRLELLKVENELKVCKDALHESKEKQKLLERKHKNDYEALEQRYQTQRVEVEIELKDCKAELKKLQDRKNSHHVIDVDDLCESMPPTISRQHNVVGNSGTKSSFAEAILLSDSDDDCALQEPKFSGLKGKRAWKQEAEASELKKRRRISVLEELLASDHKAWKSLFSKVERSAAAVRETRGGVVVKLESTEVDADVAPSLGIPKFPSENAVSSGRGYESAVKDTEMLCVKTEIREDRTESLRLTGVERMPMVAERKSVLFPNADLEVGADSDSSTCSSSSSADSEDDKLLRSQLDDLLPKIKAKEGRSSLV